MSVCSRPSTALWFQSADPAPQATQGERRKEVRWPEMCGCWAEVRWRHIGELEKINKWWFVHFKIVLSFKTLRRRRGMGLSKDMMRPALRRWGAPGLDRLTDRYSPLQWTHYSPGPTSPAAWASACFCKHTRRKILKLGTRSGQRKF